MTKTGKRNCPANIARICKEKGAQTISIVSAVGANPRSFLSYTQLKGRIEQDILNLHYTQTLVFRRPGMIMGKRTFYRPMEKPMMRIGKYIHPVRTGKLSKYRGIQPHHIAQAMLLNVLTNQGPVNILHWKSNECLSQKKQRNEPYGQIR